MSYLVIKNWERFQHYGNRRPPWIKLHVALLNDEVLESLGLESRLFYVLLLLVNADNGGVIHNDLAWLSREVSMPRVAVKRALTSLSQAGFLSVVASKPASTDASESASAPASNDASASRAPARWIETEGELERERDKTKAVEKTRASGNGEGTALDFNIPETLTREMPS